MSNIKIVLKENNVARISDQLDEQGIDTTPDDAKSVHILFYTNSKESIGFQEARVDAVKFNLLDYGILDDIENIDISYDIIHSLTEKYRAEITIKL